MPTAWQRIYRTAIATNVLPASAVETVVATLIISDAGPDSAVELEGWVKLTTGASTTSIVPRIRRDGLAGALVGDQTAMAIIGAVGETHEYGIKVVDTPGEVASQTYVLTIVQTAATVAGTIRQVLLRAITP
jgi:hypothetical protein